MLKIIGLKFELVEASECISVGAFEYGPLGKCYYSMVKDAENPIPLIPNDMHPTLELVKRVGKPKCKVVSDLLMFFDMNCDRGCNVVTIDKTDYDFFTSLQNLISELTKKL